MSSGMPTLRPSSGEDLTQHMPRLGLGYNPGNRVHHGTVPYSTLGGFHAATQQVPLGLGVPAVKIRTGAPDDTSDSASMLSQHVPLAAYAPQPAASALSVVPRSPSVNAPPASRSATSGFAGVVPQQGQESSMPRGFSIPDSVRSATSAGVGNGDSSLKAKVSSGSFKLQPDLGVKAPPTPPAAAASTTAAAAAAAAGAASNSTAAAAASTASELSRLSVTSGSSGTSGSPATDDLSSPVIENDAACRTFTFEQLVAATDNFSKANFLGSSQVDAVFKGKLMGCHVAVKRLEGRGWQGPIEYRTEIEVLSRMRHPNIVLLMGHCPQEYCLVYEFMPGGTLQNCLDQKKGSRLLRWYERVKVMCQMADALIYLHHHDPPIAHRDLSPSNVLVDRNANVKLADVGLARLVREDDVITAGPKGTPGYIDPEEMTTLEVSPLGDVYAFGLVCLQLLTGERSIQALQRILAEAGGGSSGSRGLSKAADVIMGMLDPSAGDWPNDFARQLAVAALKCADHRRARRPDLAEEVQPLLHKAGERAAEESSRALGGLSSQLICPISKVCMTDPVVAADGFSYERSAIDSWLQSHNSSPVTGEPLQHRSLTPNNGLRLLLKQQILRSGPTEPMPQRTPKHHTLRSGPADLVPVLPQRTPKRSSQSSRKPT